MSIAKIIDVKSPMGNNGDMDTKELRLKLPRKLLIEFRKLCVELELSAPKTMAQLIEQFLQVQKDNLNLKKMINGMEK